MTHTPRRIKLAGAQQTWIKAADTNAAPRKDHDKLREQVERAQGLSHEKENALLDFDRQVAQEIGQSWPPRDLSPAERERRRILQEDAEAAARMVPIIQSHAADAYARVEETERAVAAAASQVAEAALAVLIEEAHFAIEHLQSAMTTVAAVDSQVKSIIETLTKLERFPDVEALNVKAKAIRWTQPKVDTSAYLDFLGRLRTDADATVAVS